MTADEAFPRAFLEAAADWADRKAVTISFERDEYSGWFAKISFRDARGPYSAVVDAINIGSKESPETFAERVEAVLNKFTVAAHARRIPLKVAGKASLHAAA